MARKIRLISNWKRAHTFGSIWWCVAGILSMLLEILNNTWFSLPQEIQQRLPNASVISLCMFIGIMVARIIQWIKPEDDDAHK